MEPVDDIEESDWKPEYESTDGDVFEWLKTQDAKVVRKAFIHMLGEVNQGAFLATIMLGRRPSLDAGGTVSRLVRDVAGRPESMDDSFMKACRNVSFYTAFGRRPTRTESRRLLKDMAASFEDTGAKRDEMPVAVPPSGDTLLENGLDAGGRWSEGNDSRFSAATWKGNVSETTVLDMVRFQNKYVLQGNIERTIEHMVIGATIVTTAMGCRPIEVPEPVHHILLDEASMDPKLISLGVAKTCRIIVFYTVFGRLPKAGEADHITSLFMSVIMDEIRKAALARPDIEPDT